MPLHQTTVSTRLPKVSAGWRSFAAALLALSLAGCAGTASEKEGLALGALPAKAAQPLAPGKARIVVQRTGEAMYSGVPATVKLNDEKVADLWAGGSEVIDISPGKKVLTVEAWSYPGTYRLELDAKAGTVYRVAIGPRAESFGPSLILGPLGGLVDKDEKGNTGAFTLQLAGSEPGGAAKADAKPPAKATAKAKKG